MSIFAKFGHKCGFKSITMNISFTDKQTKYIANQVDSGDFQNASEVVRDALRLHEIYRHRIIEDLRIEIEKGWSGPASQRTVKDILESKRQ